MPFKVNLKEVKNLFSAFAVEHGRFKISKIEPYTNKNGDDSARVHLICMEPEFLNMQVQDNLIFNDASMWKVKQLLVALGVPEDETDYDFEAAVNSEIFIGQSVYCDTNIQKQTQIDPKTGKPYPDKTNIVRYYPKEESGVNHNL